MTIVDEVRERIAVGKPVRRTLAPDGRLHVDRPLPFLCVYRPPVEPDLGTADLVRSQASYLIAPSEGDVTPLIRGVAQALVEACGACLVLELWTGGECYRLHTRTSDRLATTIDALAEALRTLGTVEIVSGKPVAPPGREPLIADAGVLVVGLEVPPVFRSATATYPTVLRALSRDLMHALQRGFFEFTRVQTPARPEHFQMMGRRSVVQAVRDSDLALAEMGTSFDFLLAITPINIDTAWDAFRASGCKTTPTFHYRALSIDPELGKRKLYDLPLERLEDPVLAQLLREKRRELDRQLALLDDRETPRFLHGSIQLYGEVDDGLLEQARAILAAVPRTVRDSGPRCDANEIAERAAAEIAHYQLATKITIRDDIASLTVSHGDLLIPRSLDVPAHRVDALLQHEIGTHVVTYANGRAQPLRVLAAGLAGYEALQEGLAMFAEHVVGGLDGERLRLVAARVIAVRRLVERVAFPDVVAELRDQYAMPGRAAFGVAVRVFRGGGLTKDALYLRGLVQLLAGLRDGVDVATLLVGKIAFEQITLVEELVRREVLHAPTLRPRWLDRVDTSARPERARRGLRPIDLVEEPT